MKYKNYLKLTTLPLPRNLTFFCVLQIQQIYENYKKLKLAVFDTFFFTYIFSLLNVQIF